ncbi:GNAT family N-acetyltransferase [Haladaptatus sp. NG-SE-30]
MPGARVVSGERVTLRTVERDDLQFLQRADTDPELREPLGETVKNLRQVEEEFERQWGHDDVFLVCLDGNDVGSGYPDEGDVRRIGLCVASGQRRSRPVIGYWLVPEVHGEGYGKEAVSLVIDYVFQVYSHPAVGADAFAHNEASRGLLESLGFTLEGRLRKEEYWDGQYRDRVVYGLLRSEWDDRE